jgi:hypothetical protein
LFTDVQELKECVKKRYSDDVKLQTFIANIQRRNNSELDLREELKSLSSSLPTLHPLEDIKSRAENLLQRFQKMINKFQEENLFEKSMLCEVSKLNFVTFLNVFEIEVGENDSSLFQRHSEELAKINQELKVDLAKEIVAVANQVRRESSVKSLF